MADRRYSFTRLDTGDYVWPNNTLTAWWRVMSYPEDGTAERGDGTPVIGTFWALFRIDGGLKEGDFDCSPWDQPPFGRSRWIDVATGFETRRAAVEYALTREPEVTE